MHTATTQLSTAMSRVLRSVALLPHRDSLGALHPAPAAVAEWIKRWDTWYRNVTGVEHEFRYDRLYGRQLSVLRDFAVSDLRETAVIGRACRDASPGYQARVVTSSCLDQIEEFMALAREGWLQGLIFVLDHPPERDGALRDMLRCVSELNVQVGFTGNVSRLLASEVLGLDELNAMTIVVTSRHEPPARRTRPRPCEPIMRICIDSNGDVYPCLGTVGVPVARLGHIEQDLSELRFFGATLDLEQLAQHGPTLSEVEVREQPDMRIRHLPANCLQHRAQLSGLQSGLCLATAPARNASKRRLSLHGSTKLV